MQRKDKTQRERQRAEKPVNNQDKGRRGDQLEREIAALEEKLSREDKRLAVISHSGDSPELEAAWNKREELQARLDELMERWLELEE